MPRLALAAFFCLTVSAASAQVPRAACVDGQAVVPDVGAFPCERVDLVGYLPVSAFATADSPAPTANNDIWGWTDPETGVEYALVGTRNGTGFVSLEDPAAPRLVAKLPSENGVSAVWRDIKVYADHAFVVADGARDHGMQVVDLTRLRGLDGEPVTLAADAVYPLVESAHNVVIDEASGFAYAVGANYPVAGRAGLGLPESCDPRGFHAIDVRDPLAPTFAGCFSDVDADVGFVTRPGYTHDAQCVTYDGPDADYAGRELCFGSNEDAVTVFDVTDKDAVAMVSQVTYVNHAYTHQGWLTEDQRYLLVDDELDENLGLTQRTIVFDLEDLDDPEVAFIYDSGLVTTDHNLYVRGRYAFESNYTSGLRILDLGGIGTGRLEEVAYFDTYPPARTYPYDGQWSNYPYFESGLVIANDGTFGLFVLRPDAALDVARADGPRGPVGYALSEPRPNPTASGARLSLEVDAAQAVRAELFDVAGRRVVSVFDGTAGPGAPVELRVEARDLPAGVYVVRVTGETFEASRRLVLTR